MPVSIRIAVINLLILIFSLQPVYSEEQATPINFLKAEEFPNHNGQLVTIRGFLYESPGALMILAAEPNLKSCCVGSTSKRERQLLVTGDVDPAISGSSAVTLQGIMVIALGDSFPVRLENSVVVPDNEQCYGVLGLIAFGLFLAFGGAFLYLRKKQDL